MTGKELLDKYPNILKTYPSCSNGWYWILDQVLSNLEFDINHNNYPKLEIIDIKEKYGRLNMSVVNANDKQHALITFLERTTYHICEECGSTYNIGHTRPWIKTLCHNCYINSDKYFSNWTPELFDD